MSGPKEFTSLEMAVVTLFGVYETNKGANGKLNKDAFLKVLKDELPRFDQSKAGDELFKGMDLNADGSVDFKEFATMVAMFACVSHAVLTSVLKDLEEKRK